jgi:ankyrin repeat protein/uncharacterized protein YecT (DUF1311 family)
MSYDISRAVHPRMLALLAFFSLGFPCTAPAVSFDCTKASSRVEKLICTDSDLSRLDDALAVEYRAIRRIGFFDSQVKPQRAWVMKRNACHNKACVQALYESRIAELNELVNNLPGPSAERPESPEYVVKCDPRKGILSILESGAPDLDPSEEEPPPTARAVEHIIRPGSLTKGEERDGQFFLLAEKEENFQCRLGTTVYRVTIAPYIFNTNAMGECGAAEPVISAQVIRDGQVILADQRFATCRGAEGRVIHRIRIDERQQSMRVLATLDAFVLPLSIEKSFSFSALPAQFEHAVFDSFPTGDVDVDLFLAVRKRDPDQVRKALAMGAAPNTTDMNGFTPLSYLWKGSWRRPAAGRTLEQEDRNAEDIAEVLFANGASGNVKNNNGVSLLEYLIGDAPPRVIDLLLQHGADPKSDRSLANAAAQGDVRLVEKLLALGADPNARRRDDSTALWSASISGFYPSHGDRPRRSMDDYVRCVRLLLRNGAKVDAAIRDSEGMLWFLVRSFSKDERLKLILVELIPHSSQAAIKKARDLSIKLEASQEGATLSTWLGQFVRP